LKKKEAEPKTIKLKEDEVERRLAELKAEVASEAKANVSVRKSDKGGAIATRNSSHSSDKSLAKNTLSSHFNVLAFWAITLISLILAQTPGINWLFTPLNQFSTMVHELCHAIVCILTGGHVSGLTFVSDGEGHGGITSTLGGMPFLIVQAGYLGTAVFGCLLIYLGQFSKLSKLILGALGLACAYCTVTLIGFNVLQTGFAGIASFLWGLALAGGLLFAAVKLDHKAANLTLLFLAIQTALNSLSGIFLLVQIYCGLLPVGTWSDASTMENMTHIPSFVWSLLWFISSIAMLGFTLWHTYGKRLFSNKAS
jgi:hypothetical protein